MNLDDLFRNWWGEEHQQYETREEATIATMRRLLKYCSNNNISVNYEGLVKLALVYG